MIKNTSNTTTDKISPNDKISLKITPLRTGQIIDGRIIEIAKNVIFVDLGPYKTGVILGKEVRENKEVIRGLKANDPISAMVTEIENDDGYVELSFREAYYKRAWETLRELKDGDFPTRIKITQANRGGLVISARGIIGFLPVSQLSSEHYPHVENGDPAKIVNELNKFVNQEMEVKILDLNEEQQKLIVSEKAMEEKKIKELLEKYKVGDIVEAEVTNITDFGAFVKVILGETAIDGLIHIAEMDWQLVDDPRKVVKVGEKVEVKIVGIDGNRLLLSLKALKKDPWEEIEEKYKKGDVVKGKVAKFHPFGAFIEIDKNIYGLIHVSEFESLEAAKEALQLGKKYEFKITFFNPKAHKMTLSLVK